jgi:hypothetical protein
VAYTGIVTRSERLDQRQDTCLSPIRRRTRSIRAVWSISSNEAPSYYPCRGLSFNREDHAAAASA